MSMYGDTASGDDFVYHLDGFGVERPGGKLREKGAGALTDPPTPDRTPDDAFGETSGRAAPSKPHTPERALTIGEVIESFNWETGSRLFQSADAPRGSITFGDGSRLRSTFRGWAGGAPSAPWELAELCLAREVGNKIEGPTPDRTCSIGGGS